MLHGPNWWGRWRIHTSSTELSIGAPPTNIRPSAESATDRPKNARLFGGPTLGSPRDELLCAQSILIHFKELLATLSIMHGAAGSYRSNAEPTSSTGSAPPLLNPKGFTTAARISVRWSMIRKCPSPAHA